MRTLALLVVLLLGLAGAVAARDDDTDPEPPGGPGDLRKLAGTWAVTKMVYKNREMAAPTGMKYTFEAKKLVVDSGKLQRTSKLEIDAKAKPPRLTATPDTGGPVQKFAFKIEKGELYLANLRNLDPKADIDFTGQTSPVLVMKLEKK